MLTPVIEIVFTLALFHHGLAAKVGPSTEPACVQYKKALHFIITKMFYGVYPIDEVKEKYPKLCELQILSIVWHDDDCGVDTLPNNDHRITKSEQLLPEDKKRTIFDQNHPTEMADKSCMDHKRILEMMIPLIKSDSFIKPIIVAMATQYNGYVCPIVNRVVDEIESGNHDGNDRMKKVGLSRWIEAAKKIRKESCSNEAHDNIEPEVRTPSPPSPSLSPCDQFKEAIDDILTQSLTGQNSPRDAVFNAKKKYHSLCDLQIVWDDPNCGVSELSQKEDTIRERKRVFPSFRTNDKSNLQLIPLRPEDGPECIDYQRILTKMIPLALEGKPNEDVLRPVAYRYHERVCHIVRKAVRMQKFENQRNGVGKLTNSASGIQRLFCSTVSRAIVGGKKKWKNGK